MDRLSRIAISCLAFASLVWQLEECRSSAPLRPITELPISLKRLDGIEIGSDTLESLSKRLGAGQPSERREGDPTRVCYLQDERYVYFEASAAGGWKTLTGYEIATEPRVSTDHCSTPRSRLELPLDLMKTTAPEVRKALGAPTCSTSSLIRYGYQARRSRTTASGHTVSIDVQATVIYEFRRGRLVRFSFALTETT
jgi:hypothetical protein